MRRILLLLLGQLLALPVWAQVSIHALPAAAGANSTDELPTTQGGTTTRKVTVTQLGAAIAAQTQTWSALQTFGTNISIGNINLGTPTAINLSNATALALSALANQGTTTTVLHGNAAGNPSFSAVSLSADVTGNLAVGSLAAIAADNLIGNATGGSASPAAVALTSCSAGSSALTYNTTTHVFGCNTISGSGTVNSGTSGQLAYYASTGTAVSGATVGTGLALSSGTLSTTYPINAQVGTTYTVLSSDAGKLVTFNNGSAIAVTLPQATGSFGAGFSFEVEDLGAGAATITPTTSTINGAATLVIPQNMGCAITSDGTNYQVSACTALGANALQVNGAAVPTSAALLASNGSKQLTAVTVGTGVITALGVNTGSAGAVVVNGGVLGTPSSGTLTNATGLPVGGIAAMAANTIAGNGTGGSASPTALAIGALNIAVLQATTTFTVAGTGCTPSAHAGTAFGGTVTLAAGPCTSLTITINGATGFTATTGYHCNVGDRTLQNAGTWFGEWPESATSTTTATLPIPSAAGATDVISFNCVPY